ncbi:MAG: hypothetical protein QOJ42_3972, partial [Acidobacteriaceae bacterium]|nr:hypothetical protein [Acidobacteriaceae bacterium]
DAVVAQHCCFGGHVDSGPTRHQGGPDDGAAFRIADGRCVHRVMLFADSWVVRECKIAESLTEQCGHKTFQISGFWADYGQTEPAV